MHAHVVGEAQDIDQWEGLQDIQHERQCDTTWALHISDVLRNQCDRIRGHVASAAAKVGCWQQAILLGYVHEEIREDRLNELACGFLARNEAECTGLGVVRLAMFLHCDGVRELP